MAQKAEKSVQQRIKSEITRLNGIYKHMPDDIKKAAKSLIANAAFMSITLEDLQNTINTDGVTSKYQNGENQFGTKKSPEVEIHIAMTKNHSQIMKQLTDMLQKSPPPPGKGDDFEEF